MEREAAPGASPLLSSPFLLRCWLQFLGCVYLEWVSGSLWPVQHTEQLPEPGASAMQLWLRAVQQTRSKTWPPPSWPHTHDSKPCFLSAFNARPPLLQCATRKGHLSHVLGTDIAWPRLCGPWSHTPRQAEDRKDLCWSSPGNTPRPFSAFMGLTAGGQATGQLWGPAKSRQNPFALLSCRLPLPAPTAPAEGRHNRDASP